MALKRLPRRSQANGLACQQGILLVAALLLVGIFWLRVFTQLQPPHQRPDLTPLPPKGKETILVFHEYAPLPSVGSDERLLFIIRTLVKLGHKVVFAGRIDYQAKQNLHNLEELGIEALIGTKNETALLALMERHKVTMVLVTLWFWESIPIPNEFGDFFETRAPQVVRVLLSDDAHSYRMMLSQPHTDKEQNLAVAKYLEKQALKQADKVWMISRGDRERILADWPFLAPKIDMLPFTWPGTVVDPDEVPGFGDRRDIVFMGHGPNIANQVGVEWFVDNVWSRVLVNPEVPDVRLKIGGEKPWPRPWKFELNATRSRIDILGFLSDAEKDTLMDESRVFIAPLVFSTGVITKIVFALSRGLPTLTTTSGASGLLADEKEDTGFRVYDSPADFEKGLVDLYKSASLWQRLHTAGPDYVRQRYNAEAGVRQLEHLMQTVRRRKPL